MDKADFLMSAPAGVVQAHCGHSWDAFFFPSWWLQFPFHLSSQDTQELLKSGPQCCCQASEQVLQKVSGNTNPDFFALTFPLNPVQDSPCMESIVYSIVPAYIKELLQRFNTSRNLRSPDQGLLAAPGFRLKTKGDFVFEAVAPKLWHFLPKHWRSVDTFKKQHKTHFYRLAFGNLFCPGLCLQLDVYI